MLKVVQGGEESDGGTAGFRSLIDEIVRDGARKMVKFSGFSSCRPGIGREWLAATYEPPPF